MIIFDIYGRQILRNIMYYSNEIEKTIKFYQNLQPIHIVHAYKISTAHHDDKHIAICKKEKNGFYTCADLNFKHLLKNKPMFSNKGEIFLADYSYKKRYNVYNSDSYKKSIDRIDKLLSKKFGVFNVGKTTH